MASTAKVVSEAHHYVPKFYLKGFTGKKVLWVYEQGKPPRASKPKAEAHRDNFYTYDDKGYPDNSIEKSLSSAESVVAPIFKKIANPQFQMSEDERVSLFAFVAMTFVRVPAFRSYLDNAMARVMKQHNKNQAQNAEEFYAHCKEVELATDISLGNYEDMRQFMLKGEYQLTQKSAGYNLKMMFESCMHIMEILLREYRHDIWYAPPDMYFMTCDNPVVTIRPTNDGTAFVGMGFGWPDTEVLFPLNKRACLSLARRCREEKAEIGKRRVNQINDMMMFAAQQYLYAPRGYRRISRLFDERGRKIKYGENAFLSKLMP